MLFKTIDEAEEYIIRYKNPSEWEIKETIHGNFKVVEIIEQ